MPTRNVVLTDHQATLVTELVNRGRYQYASEGLRLIEQREAEDAFRLETLRNAIEVGSTDFDQGRFSRFDSSEDLSAHLAALASKASSET